MYLCVLTQCVIAVFTVFKTVMKTQQWHTKYTQIHFLHNYDLNTVLMCVVCYSRSIKIMTLWLSTRGPPLLTEKMNTVLAVLCRSFPPSALTRLPMVSGGVPCCSGSCKILMLGWWRLSLSSLVCVAFSCGCVRCSVSCQIHHYSAGSFVLT